MEIDLEEVRRVVNEINKLTDELYKLLGITKSKESIVKEDNIPEWMRKLDKDLAKEIRGEVIDLTKGGIIPGTEES
jgi:hypothetical protein